MISLFTTFIYQPFLNILIGLYSLIGVITGEPDMGIAVILLTIVIRLLLLPLSIRGWRSEEKRRNIGEEVLELEEKYAANPIKLEAEKKKLLRGNRGIIISEIFNLIVQIIIALMLYSIFRGGLTGRDTHLLYPFLSNIELPEDPTFMGISLSHQSVGLNALQSLLIFILEFISSFARPNITRAEVVRLQVVLPLVSFIVFLFLPAGKKLFVITTLCFSIVLQTIRVIRYRFLKFKEKKEAEELEGTPQEEKVVVDVK